AHVRLETIIYNGCTKIDVEECTRQYSTFVCTAACGIWQYRWKMSVCTQCGLGQQRLGGSLCFTSSYTNTGSLVWRSLQVFLPRLDLHIPLNSPDRPFGTTRSFV
ncbi:unnamed protein product, partial [Sphacelaria rigidula]